MQPVRYERFDAFTKTKIRTLYPIVWIHKICIKNDDQHV